MAETEKTDPAREAAHDADPYSFPCPKCKAPIFVVCDAPWGDPHPQRIIDAALAAATPHIAAQALTKVADKWQRGAWADAPRCADRVQERIANGQWVHEWLRARAKEVGPSA